MKTYIDSILTSSILKLTHTVTNNKKAVAGKQHDVVES